MNKIDYGMPTLIELTTVEECASLCRELGVQFIDITMNFPQYQIEKLDIHAKNIYDSKIHFTFHLDENPNIADFNDKISQAYVETIL